MRSSGAVLNAADVWSFLNSRVELLEDGVLQTGNIGIFGAWDQLVAASLADIYYLVIGSHEPSAGAGWIIEIGIGAGGSEVTKFESGIGSLNEGWCGGPCYIPAGSRIAARVKNETGNAATMRFNIVGMLNT